MDTFSLAEVKIKRLKRNWWIDFFLKPLLITVMIMCLAISVVNLVRLIDPTWNGTYLLIAILLVTVEAIYSYRILQRYPSWRVSRLRFRLAEACMLLIILKLLNFANTPWPRLKAQLQATWQDPTVLFNLEFTVMLFLAAIAWNLSTQTIADFEALYDPFTDSRFTLNRLTHRFLWGGVALVLFSGLSQTIIVSGVNSLLDLSRPSLGGIIVNVLIYFMLGFVLISQVNLTRLTIRWHLQDISLKPDLIRNWTRYGLIFLGLLTVLAFLLPTHYTMGFLEIAGRVVGLIIQAIIMVYYLIFFLLILLANLLYRLFGGAAPVQPDLEPSAPSQPPKVAPPPAPWPWWEFLQSLVFWLVALVFLIYMAKLYLEDRPELVKQLKRFKPIALVWAGLVQLWRSFTRWARQTLELLPKQVKLFEPGLERAAPNQLRHWFSRRNMEPRQRILAYYLNVLRRAEKVGTARQAHQTPYEYEPELRQTIPDVQTEVEEMTDIFVRARYSQEIFDQPQAALVKQQWQRIRRALGQKR